MTYRLQIINLDEVKTWCEKVDVYTARMLSTNIMFVATIQDAFNFIGGKLKKERWGYAGIKGNAEYILTRC